MKYIAFLRGINVGGHTKVEMKRLSGALEELGFSNVKTILNSGNVVFETKQAPLPALVQTIEKKLEKVFGFRIRVIVRSGPEIESLIKSEPFKDVMVTPQTRLYVTFMSVRSKSSLKIPFSSPEGDFKILQATNGEICSVLILSPNRGTVDLMSVIEKEFGKDITTRNWNTVIKIGQLC